MGRLRKAAHSPPRMRRCLVTSSPALESLPVALASHPLPCVRRTRGRRAGAWSRGRRSAEEGPQLVGDLTAKAAVAVGGPMRPSRVASPSQATGPLLHLVGRPVSRGCDRAGARARDTATSAGPGSFGAGRGGGSALPLLPPSQPLATT